MQHRLLEQSTVLGYLWSLLHPALTLLVLYFFFRNRMGAGIPHYAVFLLIGLVQFTHFSKSAASGMRTLHQMRTLVTGVIFPKDLLIYSSILIKAPEFIISMVLTVGIALATGVAASPALLGLPLVILIQLLCVGWTALLLAIAYVYVRDLDHIYDVGMRIFFFVTPIIYSMAMLEPETRRIVLVNPLARLIEYSRTMILEGRLPPLPEIALTALLNLGLFYLAVLLFRRSELALVERL